MTTLVVSGMPGAGRRTLVRALGDFGDLDTDVGLFLIDPAAVADGDDLRLLDELRTATTTIALVCTKIDAYWDWPDMLRRSRQVLDPDQSLPVFAVSAAAALAGGGSDCGTAELADWVHDQSMSDEHTHERRVDASDVLSEITALRTEIDTDDGAAELAELRGALLAGRDRGRTDRLHAVRAESNRLRTQAIAEIRSDTQTLVEAVAAEVGRARGREFEGWLRERFEEQNARSAARLSAELAAWQAATMAGLGNATRAERGSPSESAVQLRLPPERPVPPSAARREDLMVVLLGASAGLGLGRLVVAPMAAVDTLKWISMPLSLVLGFIVAAVVVRERRRAATRGRLRAWAADSVAEYRLGLEQDAVGAIVSAETALTGRIGRHYERSTRLVTDEVARIDRDLAESRRRRARAEGRLAELIGRRA